MYDMLQVQNIPNAHQTVRWPALCMPSLTHQGEENILKNKEGNQRVNSDWTPR